VHQEAAVQGKGQLVGPGRQLAHLHRVGQFVQGDGEGLVDNSIERCFCALLAEDGQTGLQLATEYSPHAIILDVSLPKLDGWSVMERLKDNPHTRHIPVHFMSAYDHRKDAKQKGAIGYLLKPINMEQLTTAFKRIEFWDFGYTNLDFHTPNCTSKQSFFHRERVGLLGKNIK
jgi:CheY-like chemotaxis protein